MRPRCLGRQILESHTVPAPEALARLCYSPQELGMVLQSIVEPVVLAFEADQHASRFPMPCDEDFFRLGQAQEPRQIILNLSQCRLAHSACRAPRASALLLLS